MNCVDFSSLLITLLATGNKAWGFHFPSSSKACFLYYLFPSYVLRHSELWVKVSNQRWHDTSCLYPSLNLNLWVKMWTLSSTTHGSSLKFGEKLNVTFLHGKIALGVFISISLFPSIHWLRRDPRQLKSWCYIPKNVGVFFKSRWDKSSL